ncbi:MAG TPA: GntR family transcriptional regulator [Fibrobacteria bacterium]|nr:GntR family transcriptional regulator [Fibrobacteria bacterium]
MMEGPLFSASKHLRDLIQFHPEQRLPTVRALSAQLGISSRDVVRAIKELRNQGLVETRPGSGTWPKGSLPKTRLAPPPRRDPAKLAEQLTKEILAGRFSTFERLPPAKSFGAEWNCHPQTARAALAILQANGLLERSGRSWRRSRPRSGKSSPHGTILLVGAGDERGRLRMDTDREIEYWREISNEAARNGLETSRFIWAGRGIEVPRGALGIVVSTWHVNDGRDLLLATRLSGLPVRTWLDGWTGPIQEVVRAHPRLRLHDVALSAEAGRAMGIHLLQRGFRRVAWVSPFHASTWSRARETGLRTVLESAGAQVESFTLPAVSQWDYLTKAWADPGLRTILDVDALDRCTDHRSHPVISEAAQQLGRKMILDAWSDQLEQARQWKADAWVAANDMGAAIAREWLASMADRRGHPRGLAGFDDSSEALRLDLTSYRFDTAAMARSMVHGILSHRRERTALQGIVRHGGNVVPRGST